MLNNRRSDVDIIKDIITVSQGGVNKTKILYKVNLSFIQLQTYLSYLMDQELLEERFVDENESKYSRIYQPTPKGVELLTNINKTLSYFK